MDWSLYEKRININGISDRDEIINLEKEAIENKITSSPAFKMALINNVEVGIVVHSTKKPNEKTFNTLPNQTHMANIGDIILWNKMHWLIVEVDFDDEITRSGKMVQCNLIIKFQNKVTKEIISRWCLATKPYTANIDDGKVLSTSNREYKIQLPYDAETRLIDLDKRFLLEKIDNYAKAYKVTSVDTLTNRYEDIEGGFLIWNLTQTEFNKDTDNSEMMIADYIVPDSPIPPVEPEPTLLKCEITGSSTLRCGGLARSYRAVFYQDDGITVNDTVTAVWAVNVPLDYTDKITYIPNGNSISLSCMDDISLVGVKFDISLNDNAGLYTTNKKDIEVISII